MKRCKVCTKLIRNKCIKFCSDECRKKQRTLRIEMLTSDDEAYKNIIRTRSSIAQKIHLLETKIKILYTEQDNLLHSAKKIGNRIDGVKLMISALREERDSLPAVTVHDSDLNFKD